MMPSGRRARKGGPKVVDGLPMNLLSVWQVLACGQQRCDQDEGRLSVHYAAYYASADTLYI